MSATTTNSLSNLSPPSVSGLTLSLSSESTTQLKLWTSPSARYLLLVAGVNAALKKMSLRPDLVAFPDKMSLLMVRRLFQCSS